MISSQFKFSIDGKDRLMPQHTCLWSSRDTPWKGLAADYMRNEQSMDVDQVFYATHPMVALFMQGESIVNWRARGRAFAEKIEPGMMILLDKGYELSQLSIAGGSEVIFVELDSKILERWNEGDATRFPNIHPHIIDRDVTVQFLMRSIYEELNNGCHSGGLYAESISVALISYLRSHYAVVQPPIKTSDHGLSLGKLNKVHEFIQDNIASDHSVEDLASTVGLSPSHFCRSFKQATGISPYQYVLRARIERAKAMLEFGKSSAAEIASFLGFSSHSHFSDVFRKQTGMSPTAYLEQC